MYVIVVGGGLVARSLVSLAIEDGHGVAVIEEDEEQARAMLKEYDEVEVFQANIAKGRILDEAGGKKADVLFATTGDDAANLMAMTLGKEKGIKHLITMLSNYEHKDMFEKLGFQVLIDPEKLIAKQLFSFVEKSEEKQ
ncbi:MAG: NAD-binding protein [Spirulinaceae cyanobacterium]